jgi:hypothetical protein
MNNWENMYIHIYRQQGKLTDEQQVCEENPFFKHAQLPKALKDSTQPNEQRESTHNGINR